MILQPFTVNSSRGKRYDFIDRRAIDSSAERTRVNQAIQASLVVMQQDAMCDAIGLPSVGQADNFGFGVYEGGDFVGVFLVATLTYQSGPWADLIEWEVVSNDPAVFHARPMPAFPVLSLDDSLDLSVDSAHHLLARRLTTVGGVNVEFKRLSWAIFKARTDPASRAVQRVHDKAKADHRFNMVELPDQANAARTRVDIELA